MTKPKIKGDDKNKKALKKDSNLLKNSNDINSFIITKIESFQNIIKKTILGIQKYKYLDVLGVNEINICIQALEKIYSELNEIFLVVNSEYDTSLQNSFISKLQEINNELSSILKNFGTFDLDDLITICFGSEFINSIVNDTNKDKYDILKKYVHPIGYKVMVWKESKIKDNKDSKDTKKKVLLGKNKIIEDHSIVEMSENFDCFDLCRTSPAFQTKVYGIKIAIQHEALKKTLIICGVIDDIPQSCINYKFILDKIKNIKENKPESQDFTEDDTFDKFLSSLTMKELLIYSNDEIYNKYVGIITQLQLFKQKPISQIVKEFVNGELYYQRTVLIQLLLKNDNHEFQYLAYLLYDLLSNDNNSNIDTSDQSILFDSLPWSVKLYFKEAMKLTIKYTNELTEFDNNKIPLEQQICLMKCSDIIKEKAMVKLKEVKNKSEDSGTKARQYLDGLIKIPFNIHRKEPILSVLNDSNAEFNKIVQTMNDYIVLNKLFEIKEKYTNLEMIKYIQLLKKNVIDNNIDFNDISTALHKLKRKELINIINICNSVIKERKLEFDKLLHSGKKQSIMLESIINFIKFCFENQYVCYIEGKTPLLDLHNLTKMNKMNNDIIQITKDTKSVCNYMKNISLTLDKSVHGHSNAKRQIERIIGQWMNGEDVGYCFGFEGPPGVGKTSLACQGISNCLIDENKSPRPFSLIAIGGSSNGSTLEGHNYTYVGSTWGKIVDILMDKKCMNPIIFIDELDKVSKTEHGREIIGILTHLTDPSQNNDFQDKYFSGIGLDLSKVLFIFSYNDPALIDRILLDRIHRVQFKHLTLEDKLTVVNKHIIPEVTEKMGLVDNVVFDEEVITFIIEHYTYEPGVRKLKELIFEIVGEINLQILQNENNIEYEIPYVVTKEEIINNFLKDRHPVKHQKIHCEPTPGVINGLYANGQGKGGIISIETYYFLSGSLLDLKLTGLQGDVMKESMNVAKTLAWNLTTDEQKLTLIEKFEKTKNQGIHIHCPEGAVPKDGPSAGTAITTCIYSILNNKKIKNDYAITGEINLQGKVTQIGGLDLKIIGGITAGVKHFIFPAENQIDFDKFYEKYKDDELLNGIKFNPVDNIHEVFDMIFE
jgi:ATP-dependent Lon protease